MYSKLRARSLRAESKVLTREHLSTEGLKETPPPSQHCSSSTRVSLVMAERRASVWAEGDMRGEGMEGGGGGEGGNETGERLCNVDSARVWRSGAKWRERG